MGFMTDSGLSYLWKTYVVPALKGKQDNLTFDSAPTAGSSNPVTSDGVKAAIDAISLSGGNNILVFEANVSFTANGAEISLPQGTTYESLNTAIANNIQPVCVMKIPSFAGDLAGVYAVAFIRQNADGSLVFSSLNKADSMYFEITTDGSISYGISALEKRENKITYLSESATDEQYPSAKAVYRLVEERSIQSDYNQAVSTSGSYIKNRPFYDNELVSIFNSDITPNPTSFSSPLGYIFHKISDITPAIDFLSDTIFTFEQGSTSIPMTPAAENIVDQRGHGVLLIFQPSADRQFCFYIAYNAGQNTVDYMGTTIEVSVPEIGIYIAWESETIAGGVSVVTQCRYFKKIDSKFIPEDVLVDTIHITGEIDDENYLHLDAETAEKIHDVTISAKTAVIHYYDGATIIVHHMGSGVFSSTYILLGNVVAVVFTYDHTKQAFLVTTRFIDNTATTSTYGLRQSTAPTFAEAVEMLRQSAIERGLLTETEQGGDLE